jgi:hypothetical protein
MIGYFRVKRFEMSVRASRAGGPPALTAEDMQRDIALRRNLEEVFGISVAYDSEGAAALRGGIAERERAQAERSPVQRRDATHERSARRWAHMSLFLLRLVVLTLFLPQSSTLQWTLVHR